MRFVLYATALDGEDELLRLIDRLVDRVADEAHRVEVPDADLLRESGWYKEARQSRRRLLTEVVAIPPRKHINSNGPHAKQIEVRNIGEARIADKLAHTPLTILVEDREADGILLDILVEELGSPELKVLWKKGQKITPEAFKIENSGGIGAMPQRIERAMDDAMQQGCPLRLFVLCDSDKRWPGDNQCQSYELILKLCQKCTDLDIPIHVLQKRASENYIPDAVIEAVRDDPRNANRVNHYNALLERSPVQRDHFPIKDGLDAKERSAAINAGLYAREEEPNLILLQQRLFPKRPRPFLLLNNERRSEFTAVGLRERDGNDELDTLVNAIAREL
jgi:hypothetical protein